MDQPYNGISARDLPGATWHRSRRSSPNGNCVEIATLGRETMPCATPRIRTARR